MSFHILVQKLRIGAVTFFVISDAESAAITAIQSMASPKSWSMSSQSPPDTLLKSAAGFPDAPTFHFTTILNAPIFNAGSASGFFESASVHALSTQLKRGASFPCG